ncbi:hypothetical protein [Prosthecobacter sp.]|uniref:hypothetical protein n=1 Tax=Prosthecobacter sp. TaxID=1965333 RepID=UPI00378335AA
MNLKLLTRIALCIFALSLIVIFCREKQATTEQSATQQDTLFPASMKPGTVDQAAAIAIAHRAVAANDKRAATAIYKAHPEGGGWWVLVRCERIDSTGQPQSSGGSTRSIHIDDQGAVTSYLRGK